MHLILKWGKYKANSSVYAFDIKVGGNTRLMNVTLPVLSTLKDIQKVECVYVCLHVYACM